MAAVVKLQSGVVICSFYPVFPLKLISHPRGVQIGMRDNAKGLHSRDRADSVVYSVNHVLAGAGEKDIGAQEDIGVDVVGKIMAVATHEHIVRSQGFIRNY